MQGYAASMGHLAHVEQPWEYALEASTLGELKQALRLLPHAMEPGLVGDALQGLGCLGVRMEVELVGQQVVQLAHFGLGSAPGPCRATLFGTSYQLVAQPLEMGAVCHISQVAAFKLQSLASGCKQ